MIEIKICIESIHKMDKEAILKTAKYLLELTGHGMIQAPFATGPLPTAPVEPVIPAHPVALLVPEMLLRTPDPVPTNAHH